MPAPPRQPRNDFAAIAPALEAAAAQYALPYELLVAQCLQESSWRLAATRYEPAYDRRHVSDPKAAPAWRNDAGWVKAGPTAAAWFEAHPQRLGERVGGDWGFVAQTRIASSYGPVQLMYPTAKQLGYVGLPEGLATADSCRWGAKLLAFHYRQALARPMNESDALAVALARYNGGAAGNDEPGRLRNALYVRLVAKRYRECWGRDFLRFPV